MHPALKIVALSLLAIPVLFLLTPTHFEISDVQVQPEAPVTGEASVYTVTINNTGEEALEFGKDARLVLEVDGDAVKSADLMVDPNLGGPAEYLRIGPGSEETWKVTTAEDVAGVRNVRFVLRGSYIYGGKELQGESTWETDVRYRNPPVRDVEVWVTASGGQVKPSVIVSGGQAYTGQAFLTVSRGDEQVFNGTYDLRGGNGFQDYLDLGAGDYVLTTGFGGEEKRVEFSFAGDRVNEVLYSPEGSLPPRGIGRTGNNGTLSTTADGVTTAQVGGTGLFGLLPMWQAAYNGSSHGQLHDYDFDDDGVADTQQCGNCHMGGGSKHSPPLHPLGLGSLDSGEWFFDDDSHRGPNTRLPYQESGLLPGVGCGDCHTPTNPDGFATPRADGSNDPHSVHRDVINREGCIRCHTYDDETFERQPRALGKRYQQGNATRATFGIVNPLNMTRAWDGTFLSTSSEANYTRRGNAPAPGGKGWNRYGRAESTNITQFSCGDCHGQYHLGRGIGFTFDGSVDSRLGPIAIVNDNKSAGVASGGYEFTCGYCHVTDAHAVHTNGRINQNVNFAMMDDMSRNVTLPGVRGAELCGECHAQAISNDYGGHFTPAAATRLGLEGARDAPPGRPGMGKGNADCGFCHF